MPDAISQIVDCALTSWTPGIGDPDIAGWVTVGAYLAAAIFSLVLATKQDRQALERAFWTVTAGGLLFLAVNKQLDLQSFMTAVGRCAATRQGWYDMRHIVQVDFIIGLIATAIIGGIGALWILRSTIHRTAIALFGLVWITGFVLVRAVGFQDFDRLFGVRLAGLQLNWAFELGGIAVFILGCVVALCPRRPTRAGS